MKKFLLVLVLVLLFLLIFLLGYFWYTSSKLKGKGDGGVNKPPETLVESVGNLQLINKTPYLEEFSIEKSVLVEDLNILGVDFVNKINVGYANSDTQNLSINSIAIELTDDVGNAVFSRKDLETKEVEVGFKYSLENTKFIIQIYIPRKNLESSNLKIAERDVYWAILQSIAHLQLQSKPRYAEKVADVYDNRKLSGSIPITLK